jgi:hypothetical protein
MKMKECCSLSLSFDVVIFLFKIYIKRKKLARFMDGRHYLLAPWQRTLLMVTSVKRLTWKE